MSDHVLKNQNNQLNTVLDLNTCKNLNIDVNVFSQRK